MIIGIDGSKLSVEQKTGTEYYSSEIIKNLIENRNYNFRIYTKEKIDFLENRQNVEQRVLEFKRFWTQIKLSREIKIDEPDVLFIPAHTLPRNHGKKTVVTLHDVGFKYFPELYTPLERYYHDFSMRYAIKHATRIIAISNATKKDIINLYGADPKKIDVVYHGFDKDKFKPANSEKPHYLKKYGDYIYFIGRLEAKKNIVKLVEGFEIFKKKNSSSDLKLVLAGRPGFEYEQIKSKINQLPDEIKKDIFETGYIKDSEMGEYLKFAKIFAFPSRFEGFGMPVLEAMASGVPVCASKTTSLPEIIDDCGILFDENNEFEIAESFEKILFDKEETKKMVSRAINRAKTFSWEKAADETLKVIDKALKANY